MKQVLPIVLAPRGSIGPFFRWFNKLYVPLRFQPLHEEFVRLANDSYGMQVEYVDLKQQNELDRINREFAQNTEGKVNTVFNQGPNKHFLRAVHTLSCVCFPHFPYTHPYLHLQQYVR
jgi:hypothetical protein